MATNSTIEKRKKNLAPPMAVIGTKSKGKVVKNRMPGVKVTMHDVAAFAKAGSSRADSKKKKALISGKDY